MQEVVGTQVETVGPAGNNEADHQNENSRYADNGTWVQSYQGTQIKMLANHGKQDEPMNRTQKL